MTEQLIHGLHAVAAVLKHESQQVRELWVERQRHDGRMQAVLDAATNQGVSIHPTDRAELDRLCGGARHQGIVARLAVQPQRSYDEADLPDLLTASRPSSASDSRSPSHSRLMSSD